MAKSAGTWDISGRMATTIVGLLFLAGLGLRLAYWFELRASDLRVLLFSESLDSYVYNSWAERIAGGDLMLGDELFTLSPMYSYLLAPIYKLGGSDMFTALLVQLLFGAVGILIMYAAGSLVFNRFVGILAAGFTAFYGQYLLTEGLILSVGFVPFLTAVFILWTAWALKRGRPALFLVSGLIFGALFSLRPQYFPVVLFLPLFGLVLPFLWHRFIRKNEAKGPEWNRILLMLASGAVGAALMVAPFVARNLAATGKLVLLTISGGVNFYIGNNPEATGLLRTPLEITATQKGMFDGFAKAAGAEEYDETCSRYYFRKGLEYIVDDPSGWLGLMAKKAAFFWNNQEIPLNFDLPVFKHHLRTTRFGFVPFWVVGSLGLVGLFLALRRREAGWLVVVTAGYFIGTILFFVSARYRVAAVPYIILFAAYAVDSIAAFIRRKDWSVAVGTGVLLILTFSITVWDLSARLPDSSRAEKYLHMALYFSQQGDNSRAEHWSRQALELGAERPDPGALSDAPEAQTAARSPAFMFNLALVLENQGLHDQAIEKYRVCLALHPGYFDARSSLARLLYLKGRNDEAIAEYRLVLADEPTHLNSLNGLGEALRKTGRVEEALATFERATDTDSESASSWLLRGLTLIQLRRTADAERAFRQAAGLAPDDDTAQVLLGGALLYLGRLDEAETAFQSARRIDPGNLKAGNGLAAVMAKRGRFDEAERLYRETLRLDPANSQAQRGLGAVARLRGESP